MRMHVHACTHTHIYIQKHINIITCVCVCVCVCVCSVVSDSLRPCGLYLARLLCPWDSPGKNTRAGCHFFPPRDWTRVSYVSCVGRQTRYDWATWEAPQSHHFQFQFSSVTQSCPTLRDPMTHSTPGLPVHHQLPESIQTHVHRVSAAIQPSHPVVPISSCPQSFPASGSFPSQFFASGGQRIGVSASASVLPVNIQDWPPFMWCKPHAISFTCGVIFRTDFI